MPRPAPKPKRTAAKRKPKKVWPGIAEYRLSLRAMARDYWKARDALVRAIELIESMERAGAIRLPFPKYTEAMKVMRATVGK